MAIVHLSEAEAARDFPGLLARVRAGAEVVIENGASSVVIQVAAEPSTRRLSKSLQIARKHASTVRLDLGFAHDLNAVIGSHPEPLQSFWK